MIRGINVLKRIQGYLLREIIWSEHTIVNILDQLSLLMLMPLNYTGKGLIMSERVKEHLERHRASYIMRKYGIVLIYPPRRFPSDLFWRDYFQLPEFLPNNKVVIDVGASIGDFAIVMAKALRAERVIAIEPDKVYYQYLIRNIKLNNLEGKIKSLNVALGEREGLITLYKAGAQLSSRGKGIPMKYPCTTLDKLVENLGIQGIDLIKIDTEGSEPAIIRGSLNTLKIYRPKLIIEIHSKGDKHEIINVLKNVGYKLIYEKINFPKGFMEHDYISVLYLRSS